MNEDQDRSRLGNGPNNLAVLRHMAINVMQKHPTKGSLRGKFKRAAWDDTYLAQLLALSSNAITLAKRPRTVHRETAWRPSSEVA